MSNHIISIFHIPVQRRIVTSQPYRVLADVCSSPWGVVAEPIIIKSRLLIRILSLVLERYERRGAFPLSSVDVKLLLPYLVAVIVKCLQGSAEVVRHDGEALAVGSELGSRNKRVLLKEPGCDICLSGISSNFLPLVQRYIAIPHEMSSDALIGLLGSSTQRIVCE